MARRSKSRRQSRRGKRLIKFYARRNPEGGLAREVGMTVGATLLGAGTAVAIEKYLSDAPKGTSEADKVVGKFSNNEIAGYLLAVGVIGGVGLHVKDIAPRVGKALLASSVALAGARYLSHMKDGKDAQGAALTGDALTAALRRTPGSRGIEVAPVLVSSGAYGYLPSSAAVGAQYGTMPTGAAVSAQYGTVAR